MPSSKVNERNLNTGGNNYDATRSVQADNSIHHARRIRRMSYRLSIRSDESSVGCMLVAPVRPALNVFPGAVTAETAGRRLSLDVDRLYVDRSNSSGDVG